MAQYIFNLIVQQQVFVCELAKCLGLAVVASGVRRAHVHRVALAEGLQFGDEGVIRQQGRVFKD